MTNDRSAISSEIAHFLRERRRLLEEGTGGFSLPSVPCLQTLFKHGEECFRRALLGGIEQHAHAVHYFRESPLSQCYADQRPQGCPLKSIGIAALFAHNAPLPQFVQFPHQHLFAMVASSCKDGEGKLPPHGCGQTCQFTGRRGELCKPCSENCLHL